MDNVFKKVEVGDIKPDDHIIALMGPTGVGKSTFIQVAANQPIETVGHDLKSHTQDLKAVRGRHPFDPSRSIVFLDTPGFEDTERSDGEILKLIAKWLKKTYNQNLTLSGIIYLHRISDRRMRGAQLKNLRMFGQIVGSTALSNVVLATTMWSAEQSKYNLEVQREKELKNDYWKPMLDNQAQVARFWKTHVSAWEICNQVLQVKIEHPALLIQEEMVDLKRALGQTAAGLQLFNMLQDLLKQQQETLRKIRQEADAQGDPALSRALNEEYEETQGKVDQTYEQLKEMKVPLGKRILAFFSIRRTHAAPVHIAPKS